MAKAKNKQEEVAQVIEGETPEESGEVSKSEGSGKSQPGVETGNGAEAEAVAEPEATNEPGAQEVDQVTEGETPEEPGEVSELGDQFQIAVDRVNQYLETPVDIDTLELGIIALGEQLAASKRALGERTQSELADLESGEKTLMDMVRGEVGAVPRDVVFVLTGALRHVSGEPGGMPTLEIYSNDGSRTMASFDEQGQFLNVTHEIGGARRESAQSAKEQLTRELAEVSRGLETHSQEMKSNIDIVNERLDLANRMNGESAKLVMQALETDDQAELFAICLEMAQKELGDEGDDERANMRACNLCDAVIVTKPHHEMIKAIEPEVKALRQRKNSIMQALREVGPLTQFNELRYQFDLREPPTISLI